MDEATAEDLQAVDAVLAGDTDAFEVLVRRYQRLVASAVWRYGIEASEVDSLVQDIFFKTYRNLAQYRPEHAFSSWLYRLATNHVLDHLRRQKRNPARDPLPETIVDTAPAPSETLEAHERAMILRCELRHVDARYRDVLMAVYFEGSSVAEAARSLHLPEGTIKTRLMRGRHALKKLLRRNHPDFFTEPDALPGESR